MIEINKEPEELFEEFKFYEKCYFGCGTETKYWNLKTNKPVCESCAKSNTQEDMENRTP